MQVFWRVTFSKASLTLVNNGVDLTRQLVRTSGTALCRRGEIICALTVEVQDDEVREAEMKKLVKAVLRHVGILLTLKSFKFYSIKIDYKFSRIMIFFIGAFLISHSSVLP